MVKDEQNPPDQRGRILAVEDELSNRLLLERVVEDLEVDFHCVENGHTFLKQIAADSEWDVFIIDVMLPDISGFEILEQLRGLPEFEATPVLLVTGLSSREDRLRGIGCGANDFITKPFDVDELAFRVNNNLKLGHLQRELRQSLRENQRLEKLRSDLLAMIVHDFRGPLMGLFSKIDLMQLRIDSGQLGKDKFQRDLFRARGLVNSLATMSSAILDVKRLEGSDLPLNYQRCHVSQILDSVNESMDGLLVRHILKVKVDPEVDSVDCDPEILRRVIANFISNAIKFSPRGTVIRLIVAPHEGDQVIFRVYDQGQGVPKNVQSEIFSRFYRVSNGSQSVSSSLKNARYSTGLGLTFCKLAIESHQGEIGVQSDGKIGSCFWFSIPREAPSRV